MSDGLSEATEGELGDPPRKCNRVECELPYGHSEPCSDATFPMPALRVSDCEATTCWKCGGAEITTRYHDGENYWGDNRHCANGSAARPTAHKAGPHLHRSCGTCGWDWTEECADAA